MSFDPEALAALLHIVAIKPGKIAAGKTEIMNCIQQVGFAHAVITTNTYYTHNKVKRTIAVVFELGKRYVLKTKH